MILPHNNLQLARQHLESLPSQSQDMKYYKGLKYETPQGVLGQFWDKFNVANKLHNLQQFYPYQRTIRATVEEFEHDQKAYLKESLTVTGALWVGIWAFARQGAVLPVLRQYGSLFGTHRVFRQYAWALVLPYLIQKNCLANKYYTHVETLQHVHANRLNQKILDDPQYTYYPQHLQQARNNLIVETEYRDIVQLQ